MGALAAFWRHVGVLALWFVVCLRFPVLPYYGHNESPPLESVCCGPAVQAVVCSTVMSHPVLSLRAALVPVSGCLSTVYHDYLLVVMHLLMIDD